MARKKQTTRSYRKKVQRYRKNPIDGLKIITSGQGPAEEAALEWATRRSKKADGGVKYSGAAFPVQAQAWKLLKKFESGFSKKTKANVDAAEATIILIAGDSEKEGSVDVDNLPTSPQDTLLARFPVKVAEVYAKAANKPFIYINVSDPDAAAKRLKPFVGKYKTLNIIGTQSRVNKDTIKSILSSALGYADLEKQDQEAAAEAAAEAAKQKAAEAKKAADEAATKAAEDAENRRKAADKKQKELQEKAKQAKKDREAREEERVTQERESYVPVPVRRKQRTDDSEGIYQAPNRINLLYFGTLKDQKARMEKTKGLSFPIFPSIESRDHNKVFLLKENEYYVFEDTVFGAHNFGFSERATYRFGAIPRKASGIQGFSYAIPTRQWNKALKSFSYLPFDALTIQFGIFRDFVQRNPQMTFIMTPMLQSMKLGPRTLPGATFSMMGGRPRTGEDYEMNMDLLTQYLNALFMGLKNVKYSWYHDESDPRGRAQSPMRYNKFFPYVSPINTQPIVSENDFAQYVNIKKDDSVLVVLPVSHPYRSSLQQLLVSVLRQKPKEVTVIGIKPTDAHFNAAKRLGIELFHTGKKKGEEWEDFIKRVYANTTIVIGSLIDPDLSREGHALIRNSQSYEIPVSLVVYQTGFPDGGYGNGIYMAQYNWGYWLRPLRTYKRQEEEEEDNRDELPPEVTQQMLNEYQAGSERRRKQEAVIGKAWQKRLDAQAETGVWLAPYVGEPDFELLRRLKESRSEAERRASEVPRRMTVDTAYSQYLTSAAKGKIKKVIKSLGHYGLYDAKKAILSQSSDMKKIEVDLDDEDKTIIDLDDPMSGIQGLINPRRYGRRVRR